MKSYVNQSRWIGGGSTTKAAQSSVITNRLKNIKISLAPVPIRDSERSTVPIIKLLDEPDQDWHLDDIEQSLKTRD